jgi:FkbM family methyltransferase
VERIPSLFDPSPLVNEPAVLANPGNALPITVRTAREQWAYALRLQRAEPRTEPSRAVLIRVNVSVDSGTIGIGCLNPGETAFIDESFVNASAAPTTVEIVVANAANVGPLIVRNASAHGAAEATLFDVECFAFDQGPDGVRSQALSDPRPCARWSRYYGTQGDTPVEKLRVQTYLALAQPQIVRWADDVSVRILPDDQLSRALFVSDTYEPNTLCVIRELLTQGSTFIDVGANTGVISLVASKWVGRSGRVYSLEPSAREYDNLLHNVASNPALNVEMFRLAAASSSGRATLRVAAASHAGLNTLGNAFPYEGVETERLETVETITLDDFVAREAIRGVAGIKVDVEGAEEAVLRGALNLLRDQRPAVVFEVFSRSLTANGSTPEALERLLFDARYRLYSIDDETARLVPLDALAIIDEQNAVALPVEKSR